MKKKNISKLGIVMFCLSGLIFIYAVWAFIHCKDYISAAAASGQLSISGNEFDIVNFYMMNSVTYITTAALLFAVGWLLQRLPVTVRRNRMKLSAPNNQDKEDEDIDEWFEEMRQDEARAGQK